MEWQVILVLAVAIVVILFPVAYVWGLTIGGVFAAIKAARRRRLVLQHDMQGAQRGGGKGAWVLPALGIYAAMIWYVAAGWGWEAGLAFAVAAPLLALPVAFVWYLNIGGLLAMREKNVAPEPIWRDRKEAKPIKTEGVAINRFRNVMPFVLPVVAHIVLIALAFFAFGWELALGVAVAIPIFLTPVVFIWYLTASGLMKVIADARRRQKRRTQLLRLREARVLIQGP